MSDSEDSGSDCEDTRTDLCLYDLDSTEDREETASSRRKALEAYVNYLKLQGHHRIFGEIEMTIKKINEGADVAIKAFEEAETTMDPHVRDKAVETCRREVRKLQKLRDTLVPWISSPKFKDKDLLHENRKLIERQMSRWKTLEKSVKLKEYSSVSLRGFNKRVNPIAKERDGLRIWLVNGIDRIKQLIDLSESEIGTLLERKGKKNEKESELKELKTIIQRHQFHIEKHETMLRILHNTSAESDEIVDFIREVKKIKDDVKYYLDSHRDPDYEENEFLYDEIDGIDEPLPSLPLVIVAPPVPVGETKEKETPLKPDVKTKGPEPELLTTVPLPTGVTDLIPTLQSLTPQIDSNNKGRSNQIAVVNQQQQLNISRNSGQNSNLTGAGRGSCIAQSLRKSFPGKIGNFQSTEGPSEQTPSCREGRNQSDDQRPLPKNQSPCKASVTTPTPITTLNAIKTPTRITTPGFITTYPAITAPSAMTTRSAITASAPITARSAITTSAPITARSAITTTPIAMTSRSAITKPSPITALSAMTTTGPMTARSAIATPPPITAPTAITAPTPVTDPVYSEPIESHYEPPVQELKIIYRAANEFPDHFLFNLGTVVDPKLPFKKLTPENPDVELEKLYSAIYGYDYNLPKPGVQPVRESKQEKRCEKLWAKSGQQLNVQKVQVDKHVNIIPQVGTQKLNWNIEEIDKLFKFPPSNTCRQQTGIAATDKKSKLEHGTTKEVETSFRNSSAKEWTKLFEILPAHSDTNEQNPIGTKSDPGRKSPFPDIPTSPYVPCIETFIDGVLYVPIVNDIKQVDSKSATHTPSTPPYKPFCGPTTLKSFPSFQSKDGSKPKHSLKPNIFKRTLSLDSDEFDSESSSEDDDFDRRSYIHLVEADVGRQSNIADPWKTVGFGRPSRTHRPVVSPPPGFEHSLPFGNPYGPGHQLYTPGTYSGGSVGSGDQFNSGGPSFDPISSGNQPNTGSDHLPRQSRVPPGFERIFHAGNSLDSDSGRQSYTGGMGYDLFSSERPLCSLSKPIVREDGGQLFPDGPRLASDHSGIIFKLTKAEIRKKDIFAEFDEIWDRREEMTQFGTRL